MIESDALSLPPEAAAAAVADFLRAGGAGETALIETLAVAAAELCERFTGTVLIARAFAETLRPTGAWQRLGRAPVRAITGVEALPAGGPAQALPPSAFSVDIDAQGHGWARATERTEAGRVRVSFEAGMAADWESLPAALRHGIVRLAAHLYSTRTVEGADERQLEPPAAVAALWRPYRRLRLA
jgi:uncharacterized phiE125 gp8 family phage protein